MTPDRFNECLAAMDWSVKGLADFLGLPHTRPRRWAEGRYPVPPEVATWLERLAEVHEKNPPPDIA